MNQTTPSPDTGPDPTRTPQDVVATGGSDGDAAGRIGCGLLAGIPIVLFGLYLVYDNTWLAVRDGVTEQRIGVIARDEEPRRFWLAVLFDASMGLAVVGFGALVLFVLLKQSKADKPSG